MKKLLSILCVFSLILGIGSITLTANAGTADNYAIEFVKLRVAETYEDVDGKKGVRFYKESDALYEMFVAKTNYELKADTKYLISMDYNCTTTSLQPSIAVMNTDSIDAWGEGGVLLGNWLDTTYNDVCSGWRRVSFIVDTAGKVDDTYKYLSFYGKSWGDAVDYKICDLSVAEIDDSFEFTSLKNHFGYIDDGERQYADYTCANPYWTGIGFAAKINVQPATEYMLMFDYKKSGRFNGTPSFTIDGTKIADFNPADTTDWKTYSVKVKTPDTITNQELKFNASTLDSACSFSFDNFRMVPLNSESIYPTCLKDFAYYQTDTNEYGWKFSESSQWVITGFLTDYVLEPNSKYLVEFDYNNPTWNDWVIPMRFYVADSSDNWNQWGTDSSKDLSSMSVSVTSEWTTNVVVLSTGDKVDVSNKYLAVYGKTGSVTAPQIAFKNLKVTKLTSDFIYPDYLKDMVMYKTSTDELAWKFSTTDPSYVTTGFSTGYTLEAGKAYAISYDYKQPVSNWNDSLFFTAGGTSFDYTALWNGGNILGRLNLSTTDSETDQWLNKTVIIKPDEYQVYENNNILWVAGKTGGGLPDFAFKNFSVTEIDTSMAMTMPNYEQQFEYYLNENNEVVWNFSKTAGSDEYSALGFATDYELEKDKGYAVVFDYNYATKGWLNKAIQIKAMGSAFSADDMTESGLLNDGNYTGDGWATLKTAYKATDVTDANKYFGLVAKTNPGATYDISIKNIRLYDLGDVNFDNKIDSEDLVSLKRHLLGTNDEIGFADANGDSSVDIRDLISVKKALTK